MLGVIVVDAILQLEGMSEDAVLFEILFCLGVLVDTNRLTDSLSGLLARAATLQFPHLVSSASSLRYDVPTLPFLIRASSSCMQNLINRSLVGHITLMQLAFPYYILLSGERHWYIGTF